MKTEDMCEACARAAYGTLVPMPGVLCMDGNFAGCIEKCDDCKIYNSDESAAYALTQEMSKRGDYGRVQIVVMAYEPKPHPDTLVCPECDYPHPEGYHDPEHREGTHMCGRCSHVFNVSKRAREIT